MSTKTIRIGTAAAAALLAMSAVDAGAQGVRISPWVGLYAPTSELGTVQAVDFGKKESTFAYGADLDFGSGPLAFRIGGGFASNSDVPVAGVGCTTCDLRATVLTATGAIVLKPLPIPVIQPYGVAGLGAKWYDFDFDDAVLDGLVSDQTRLTAQLGVGAVLFPRGSMSLFAEVSDYLSGFDLGDGDSESKTQHDLFLKIGLSIGLGVR